MFFGLSGPGCLFNNNGDATHRVWMSIAPVQCGGNAWQMEEKSLEDYLKDRGAEIFDQRSRTFAEAVCLACSCPTGERIDVLINEDHVDILLAEGFHHSEDWPY